MSKVVAIALNTFKEAVRNKVLYFLVIFAILLIVFSSVISDLSIASPEKLIKDLGLAAIDFIGFLIAVFVGVYLVYNELDKKTIYTIVSKPIDRSQFVVGKFLGLLFTIYVNVLIMSFCFFAVLYWREATNQDVMQKALFKEVSPGKYESLMSLNAFYFQSLWGALWKAAATFVGYSSPITAGLGKTIFLSALGMAIMTAFAILYSCFSTPTLSAVFTTLTYVIGSLCEDIVRYAEKLAQKSGGYESMISADKFKYWFAHITVLAVPNRSLFDTRTQAVYGYQDPGKPLSAQMVSAVTIDPWVVIYGVTYTAAIVTIACVVFRRRNFK